MPITKLLLAAAQGDRSAESVLINITYDSLKRIARNRLGVLGLDTKIEPEELVSEAWLKVFSQLDQPLENRRHYFAVAAQAMRSALIDQARRKIARKRGGPEIRRVNLSDEPDLTFQLGKETVELDEALTELEAVFPMKAKVVKLKFFAGMTNDEIAIAIGVSTATVERFWKFARAWLHSYMKKNET